MNRLYMATSCAFLVAVLCLYALKHTTDPTPIGKNPDLMLLTSPLDALETNRNYDLRIEAHKKDAERALAEAEKLKKRVAELEAQLAQAQTQPEQLEYMTFEASHYTAYCDGCSGKTATGLNVSNTIYSPEGYRIVAVDPEIIPLGAVLQITYADGTAFKALAADTGGAIKGRKLDVLVASKKEAYELGRVPVKVTILNE